MAKGKKKKAKDKSAKKGLKQSGAAASSGGRRGKISKAAKRLKAVSDNPLVADLVAAALVATASALKDSKKARQLAASAGDELEQLAREGAERGNAMWQLALDIGRRALKELSTEPAERKRPSPRTSPPVPRRSVKRPKSQRPTPPL